MTRETIRSLVLEAIVTSGGSIETANVTGLIAERTKLATQQVAKALKELAADGTISRDVKSTRTVRVAVLGSGPTEPTDPTEPDVVLGSGADLRLGDQLKVVELGLLSDGRVRVVADRADSPTITTMFDLEVEL